MKAMRKQKQVQPGFEGRFEPKEVTVVSPYRHPKTGELQNESVAKNVRHDILEFMFSRKQIDASQKANGDWFLEQCERTILGGSQALDYTKAKVDTSFKPYTAPDSVLMAIEELGKVKKAVGRDHYDLLVETIFLGRQLKEAARDRYGPYMTDYARRDSEAFIGRLWRELLTKIRDNPARNAAPLSGAGGWRGRHIPLNAGASEA